tara:strand:+ start:10907 stop:11065 length:159 start_codon:yes stop_codon:yes gene_type:complete
MFHAQNLRQSRAQVSKKMMNWILPAQSTTWRPHKRIAGLREIRRFQMIRPDV